MGHYLSEMEDDEGLERRFPEQHYKGELRWSKPRAKGPVLQQFNGYDWEDVPTIKVNKNVP